MRQIDRLRVLKQRAMVELVRVDEVAVNADSAKYRGAGLFIADAVKKIQLAIEHLEDK